MVKQVLSDLPSFLRVTVVQILGVMTKVIRDAIIISIMGKKYQLYGTNLFKGYAWTLVGRVGFVRRIR
jgi:hypothetical protein